MTTLKEGDIVRFEGAPCEVVSLSPQKSGNVIFIINKRTLNGSFILESQVEFVRRPSSEEFKRE
jgi:hypothetical protein